MGSALVQGPSLAPGAVFAGKYRIVRELGRGGVGVVVEAEHLRLRQRVAIKVLDPYFVRETNIVERFEREARAMASLKSPYITNVSDVDVLPDGTPYMVMELLHGRDLSIELKQRGALDVPEALAIAQQACEGLEVVHAAGIVHRDLKPSNLFLVPTERGVLVKVMDFGISKFEGDEVTRTNSSLGTPAYMSPEQVRSSRDVDVRADLWSLGVILFRALSGTLPFDGEGITGMSVAIVNDEPKRLSDLRPDVPMPVVDLVHRLLQKDRERRLPDAGALRKALTAVMSDVVTRPPAPTIPFIEGADEPPNAVLDSFIRSSLKGGTHAMPATPAPAPSGPSVTAPPVVDGDSYSHSHSRELAVSAPTAPAPRPRGKLLVIALLSCVFTLGAIVALWAFRPQLGIGSADPPIPPATAPAPSAVAAPAIEAPAAPATEPSEAPAAAAPSAPSEAPSATPSAAPSASAARPATPPKPPAARPPVRRAPPATPASKDMPLLL